MKLLTKEIESQVPGIGKTEGTDAIVFAKIFHPAFNWTWYLIEYDPDRNLCFGLVDGDEIELGYFCLTELERTVILGMHMIRDQSWVPMKLSELKLSLHSTKEFCQ